MQDRQHAATCLGLLRIWTRVYDYQGFALVHLNDRPLGIDNDTPVLELVADTGEFDAVVVVLDASGVRNLRLALQRWEREHR